MNDLVRIIKDDDGETVQNPLWCLFSFGGDTVRTLCRGEAIDGGTNVEYEVKSVRRGGITCEDCLDAIKHYKSIKL